MTRGSCTITHCPFSHRPCTECGTYRGRHRYMVFSGLDGRKNGSRDQIADYFKKMDALSNPWAEARIKAKEELAVRLTLIDAETGKVRPCDLDEARAWDWGDPLTMRIISDRQVTSYEQLVKVLCHREEQGDEEVKLYEFPRFMFLAGG
jgi:hypothetical protein